jgi:hypothetical protein
MIMASCPRDTQHPVTIPPGDDKPYKGRQSAKLTGCHAFPTHDAPRNLLIISVLQSGHIPWLSVGTRMLIPIRRHDPSDCFTRRLHHPHTVACPHDWHTPRIIKPPHPLSGQRAKCSFLPHFPVFSGRIRVGSREISIMIRPRPPFRYSHPASAHVDIRWIFRPAPPAK